MERGIFSLARQSLSVYGRGQFCPGGEIGKHIGLKIQRRLLLAGSSPARGTAALLIASVEEAVFRAVRGDCHFCHYCPSRTRRAALVPPPASPLRSRKGRISRFFFCSTHGRTAPQGTVVTKVTKVTPCRTVHMSDNTTAYLTAARSIFMGRPPLDASSKSSRRPFDSETNLTTSAALIFIRRWTSREEI